MPLREPSHLLTPPLYDLILRDSEGTIGEMATLLTRTTATALLQGSESITPSIIERTNYHSPSIRRRMIERELR